MRYYWFDRQKLLERTKDKYQNCGGKQKTAKYYIKNKYVIKDKVNNK